MKQDARQAIGWADTPEEKIQALIAFKSVLVLYLPSGVIRHVDGERIGQVGISDDFTTRLSLIAAGVKIEYDV